MNNRAKQLIPVLLLFAVFVAVTILTSSDKALNYPDYTTYSANTQGASLIYDVLREMDFPVEQYHYAIRPYSDIHSIQVIIAPSYAYGSYDNMEDIASWIQRGGRLLVYYNEANIPAEYLRGLLRSSYSSSFQNGEMYSHGLGYAYFSSTDNIVNSELLAYGSEVGRPLIETLEFLGYETIYFNEYYHGYGIDNSLWDVAPFGMKLLFYQVVILTILSVFYLGKRFGRPVPYYEETEREENEYVGALSNIYMSVGAGDAIIEMFTNKFLFSAAKYFKISKDAGYEQIYHYWKTENLPDLDKLEYLARRHGENHKVNTKRPGGRVEFLRTIGYLKDLTKTVTKKLY